MNPPNDATAARGVRAFANPTLAPLWIFGIGLAVYASGLFAHTGSLWPQSRWPHFLYYAQALLDGQLHMSATPPALLDLAQYEGRLYLHFPPFPAVLLMPWVGLFGLEASDRIVSVLLGASNGALLWWLLEGLDRRGLVPSTPQTRGFLCSFFLFGTVHWTLAVTSNPWEFAHVVCNTALLLALGLGFRRRYTLAALAWVVVLFTRTHVFTALPIVAGLHLWADRRESGRAEIDWRPWLPAALIAGVGALGLLGFNFARFGNPFEMDWSLLEAKGAPDDEAVSAARLLPMASLDPPCVGFARSDWTEHRQPSVAHCADPDDIAGLDGDGVGLVRQVPAGQDTWYLLRFGTDPTDVEVDVGSEDGDGEQAWTALEADRISRSGPYAAIVVPTTIESFRLGWEVRGGARYRTEVGGR